MTASHSSSLMLKIIRSRKMPAQVTRASSCPKRSSAVPMMRRAPSQSATESVLATASPPVRSISFTTSKAGPVDGAVPSTLTP